jgi:hypothetical protein
MSYVPPKRRFLQEPHGVTSQKTQFFIVTAVKAANLKQLYSSELTLLPEVNTLTLLQYNPPSSCAPPSAIFVVGVVHHQRVHFC